MRYLRTLYLLFLLMIPVSAQTPICETEDRTDRPLVVGDRIWAAGGVEGLSTLVKGTVVEIKDGLVFWEPDKQCHERALLRSKDSYFRSPPVKTLPAHCETGPSDATTLCRRGPRVFEIGDKSAYTLLKRK